MSKNDYVMYEGETYSKDNPLSYLKFCKKCFLKKKVNYWDEENEICESGEHANNKNKSTND